MTEDDGFKASLRRWAKDSSTPGIIRREGIGLKARGRNFKSAVLSYYGANPEKPSRRELTLRQVGRETFGPGYDFDNPEVEFTLSGDEIEVLQKFLNGLLADEGHYVRLGDKSMADSLADSFIRSGQNDRTLMDIFSSVARNPELAMAVSRQPEALALTSRIAEENHKDVIDLLDEMARRENPAAAEKEFQKLIEKNSWIFGGRFIEPISRRALTVLDELDVPLTAVDGSLHIVELKRSDINRLFVKHRNHWIVGRDIHEAVSQVENYLFALDSAGDNIRATLNIDVYRAIGTVVVGHLDHCTTGVTQEEAYKALRIYNSHLSRVRVLTYDQLIANARNAMALGVVGAGDAV